MDADRYRRYLNPAISSGAERMEWNGTLDLGDVMVVSKDGAVSINCSQSGNISGTVWRADVGKNTSVYGDDSSSSHNCTIEAMWNDPYYLRLFQTIGNTS